jgi:hypothetical protein
LKLFRPQGREPTFFDLPIRKIGHSAKIYLNISANLKNFLIPGKEQPLISQFWVPKMMNEGEKIPFGEAYLFENQEVGHIRPAKGRKPLQLPRVLC